MENTTLSGDSTEMSYSYQLGDSGEATSTEEVSAPQPEEGSSTEEGVQAEETTQETTVSQQEVEAAKRMVIDTVEDKFRDLSNGRLSGPELRQWFIEHPEVAETASKAKRVKEAYRTFMSTAETPAQAEEETLPEVKSEEKPVTLKEIEKMLNERETKILESRMLKERDKLTEDFASQRGIVDEEYTKLKATADALYKTQDWEYADALEAAQRALFPQKPKPVQVPITSPAPSLGKETVENENVDLSRGFTISIPQ